MSAAKETGTIDTEFFGSNEDSAETRSIATRSRIRTQLTSDVEAFLSRGGAVEQIENDVRADPPKKPTSNYGSAPI